MVFRLYSDRLRDLDSAGQLDVYQYDTASVKLRVQIVHIALRALGTATRYAASTWRHNPIATRVRDVLLQEKGLRNLGTNAEPQPDLIHYLEHAPFVDFLDALEVLCYHLKSMSKQSFQQTWDPSITADVAIAEINHRLKDAGLGFQYEGVLSRIDSQYIHAEVVIPALNLLSHRGYEGVQIEFLSAHEHYRAGYYEEAITNAAKSFESMMKAICALKGWEFKKGARASDLVKVLRANQLWPEYLDTSFDQLLATLSSGLPKVRNEDAAHGQGPVPRNVQGYIAGYALHLAAAKIVFLSEAAASQ